jgi:photosystem II stability/assembly factor-like uncharacterized protein
MAAGDKRTVSTGIYSSIMSSTDGGSSWSEVTSSNFVDNNNDYTIGFKPSSFWVTWTSPNFYTSSDNGVTWGGTGATASTQVNSLAYDGTSRWVSAGKSGKIYYSDNDFGTTTLGSYPWTSTIFGICYAAGTINKWIAVGQSGRIAYSTDGITFSASTVPGVVGLSNLRTVATDHTTLVCGGNNGMILTSSDGVNWLRVSSSAAASSIIYGITSDVIGAGLR